MMFLYFNLYICNNILKIVIICISISEEIYDKFKKLNIVHQLYIMILKCINYELQLSNYKI